MWLKRKFRVGVKRALPIPANTVKGLNLPSLLPPDINANKRGYSLFQVKGKMMRDSPIVLKNDLFDEKNSFVKSEIICT